MREEKPTPATPDLRTERTRNRALTLVELFDAECERIAAALDANPETFRSYVVGILAARELERRMFTQ